MDSVENFAIKPGLNLTYIPTGDKFKTLSVSINFHRPLCREEASYNALLADVMRRGCRKYPNQAALKKRQQELYGAYVDVDIRRKGEDQILSFMLSVVSDEYLPAGESTEGAALDLLFNMLLDPLTEQNAFRADYVEQEKVNLKNDIDAMINDKRSYALWRLIELMCPNEPYGVHELGTKEEVDAISPQSLYAHYQKILREGPVDVFVTGRTEIQKIAEILRQRFADLALTKTSVPVAQLHCPAAKTEEVTEEFDVTQAKLCLGFSTGIAPTDADYPALMLYNGILGSGAHSKLFNNVREKLSLAYYAASRLERYKGMMLISSGIEIANKQRALDEISVQMEDMRQGKISEYEFDAAMKSIVNALRSLGDDVGYLEDYYLGQTVSGTQMSLEDYIHQIMNVTADDVVRVAKRVQPEMVYFLTAKEGK